MGWGIAMGRGVAPEQFFLDGPNDPKILVMTNFLGSVFQSQVKPHDKAQFVWNDDMFVFRSHQDLSQNVNMWPNQIVVLSAISLFFISYLSLQWQAQMFWS